MVLVDSFDGEGARSLGFFSFTNAHRGRGGCLDVVTLLLLFTVILGTALFDQVNICRVARPLTCL